MTACIVAPLATCLCMTEYKQEVTVYKQALPICYQAVHVCIHAMFSMGIIVMNACIHTGMFIYRHSLNMVTNISIELPCYFGTSPCYIVFCHKILQSKRFFSLYFSSC